jgi:hypothetical protein
MDETSQARTIDRHRPDAQGTGMRGLVSFALAAVLFLPHMASAQMQPHRAVYSLRLGTAVNAPRIGSAMQDFTRDCKGWHLRRDITTEIALTSSWKITLSSKLEGEETLSGNAFRFHAVQSQNGVDREVSGRVQRTSSETHAEIVSPTGPTQFMLPQPTLMPVAGINYLIDRLGAHAANFPALTFDAEVIDDAFLVDVTELDPDNLRAAPPSDHPVEIPEAKSWPVFMTFTPGRHQNQRPLFTVNALVFATGVLDRLTIDTGLVKVAADLQSLEMHDQPACPRS